MVMVPRQMAETLRPQLGDRKLYSMLNLCFSRYFLYSLYIDGYNLQNTGNIINSAYPRQEIVLILYKLYKLISLHTLSVCDEQALANSVMWTLPPPTYHRPPSLNQELKKSILEFRSYQDGLWRLSLRTARLLSRSASYCLSNTRNCVKFVDTFWAFNALIRFVIGRTPEQSVVSVLRFSSLDLWFHYENKVRGKRSA